VVDFACISARLVIEIDGPSHRVDEQMAFDTHRTAFLEAHGWRVLRLRDETVLSDPSSTLSAVRAALAQTSAEPPHPALSPVSGGEG